MPTITEDMRRVVDQAMLSFVAPVCPDGSPNLSPEGSVHVYDDERLTAAAEAHRQMEAGVKGRILVASDPDPG